eukprot:scaffold444556_cov13-Prasinocladus_malaysianus.AAC.1
MPQCTLQHNRLPSQHRSHGHSDSRPTSPTCPANLQVSRQRASHARCVLSPKRAPNGTHVP